MKAMVIGINPNYNYPGKIEIWRTNNTKYASNLGASLITRSLMKEFNADYVDDFSDIETLKKKYDTCFIAFATHITTWRDVSYYTNIVEKLDMKTIAMSLGVQDSLSNSAGYFKLHPSMKRLLEIVSSSSKWLGVRGHYTASILQQNGFSNVIPIGCPSMYWRLIDDLQINKKENFEKPVIVYHRALAENAYKLLEKIPFVGQDYEDHVIFNDDLHEDVNLKRGIYDKYHEMNHSEKIIEAIKNKGVFFKDFKKWFEFIGQHDFIFGTRLHGCIAGLIQKKPVVMIPRDLRVNEIAEFFNIPTIKLTELSYLNVDDIYNRADFSKFNSTYKIRFNNYLKFIEENDLETEIQGKSKNNFFFTNEDLQTNFKISFNNIGYLNQKVDEISNSKALKTASALYKLMSKLPFAKSIGRKLK